MFEKLLSKLNASIFLLAVFISGNAFAITNVEGVRLKEEGNIFSGSVGASFEGRSGDKDTDERGFNFRLDATKEANNILTLYDKKLEKYNNTISSDEEYAHLRYTRKLMDVVSVEVFSQRETDRFLLMDLRALNGAGLRFNLHKNDQIWSANLGVGAYRTKEAFSDPTFDTETYNRYATYLSGKWAIIEGLGLSNTVYYQPRTSDFDDIYAFNSLELGATMVAHLKLSFKHKLSFDSKPLLDLPKTRREYGFELEWEF